VQGEGPGVTELLQKEEVDLLDWLSDYGLEVTFE
jgi:hypothetical protein